MFISYATEYDLYEGKVGIGSLPSEQQDFLIKATFSTESDVRDFVVKNNIIKKQAEGLWSVVVLIGMVLEYAKVIRDFEQRTDNDIQKIIGELAGTNLWLRLEEHTLLLTPEARKPLTTGGNWKLLAKRYFKTLLASR